jgi:uncharacterized protein
MEGKWTFFYPEGMVWNEGMFKNNTQVGVWTYYDKKKKITKKLTLKGAAVDGKGWLYENGILTGEYKMVGSAKNPKKNGPGKEFYPNGKVKSEGSYMMNRKTGAFKEYYPNGNLMAEGKYMNNKRNEKWIFYQKDGKTKDTSRSGFYMMGKHKKGFGM